MTISFILNGIDVVVTANAEQRLISILRKDFHFPEAKCGCLMGICGACSVFLDGNLVKSCLIPAFKIRGSEIITFEGFSQTDEYQDILAGFTEAEVENCGFCDTGKILTVEALLSANARPSREQILPAFEGIKCRCTEPESLVEGVLRVADIRQRRLYGRGA
ncbi:MAG: aldehyde oxidoreductase [Treponema sp.]|nr:aldehyde oxidoreductase [Treponema sp.]